jgi:hypothetical protein
MIVYTAAGFLYQLGVTAMMRSGFPDADMSRNFLPLLRSMIWSGGLTDVAGGRASLERGVLEKTSRSGRRESRHTTRSITGKARYR